MAAIASTDAEAARLFDSNAKSAESKFLDFKDLQRWGYGTMEYDDYYEFDVSLPIKPALNGIGVSTKKIGDGGGTNRAFAWEHEEETEHGGKKYPPTHASYTTLFNPEDGIIIGWGAFSPSYMGPKQDPPVTTIPDLKQWSDITYLQWAALSSSKNSSLRYVMKTPCENPTTQLIISHAMKRTKQELSKWPGVSFSMAVEEGQAILGSPNGLGVGYLLVQHRAQLGNRVVDKVTVFQDEGAKAPRPPSILFHIKEAAPGSGWGGGNTLDLAVIEAEL